MSSRLPPLHALRVFAAVAEQRSVSRAAAALHLTHSAVSQQLRQLQAQLGVALVERHGRGVRLTAAGAAYAERVGRAFAELREATQALVAAQASRPLRLSAMPSFAATWLLRRLGEFIAMHPEFDVEVQSTGRLADVGGGEVDVALRFGLGRYPGLHSERLMADWHFPVCSPAFARKHGLAPPKTGGGAGERQRVADFARRLADIPILRSDNEPWAPWFAAAGVTATEPTRGPIFDDSALMLHAAEAGQGICLGRHAITIDTLASRRLLRPFTTVVEAGNAYYFVCRPGDLALPALAALRAWLLAQAQATAQPG